VNKVYSENRFFLIDLSRVIERYELWSEKLPGVTPFYALKCNPNKYVVNVLNLLGSSFDCASQAEIETVLSIG
jgi:ornithine decarboxylase